MNHIKYINVAAALFALSLYGCSSDTVTPMSHQTASYELTFTNITGNQPVAPVAVILHTTAYSAARLGTAASTGLEMLAEGGDGTMLLSDADLDAAVLTTAAGAGPIMPGASETMTTTVSDSADIRLSVAAMLVNTNDGFAALNGLNISGLAIGDSQVVQLAVFDAGTEANSETAATIPGQGGIGFAAARDDVNFISVHRGIVTAADGLLSSALNESHRFDNPALRLMIRRIS